jgi:membrane-anchored protein YejM (alkaline phosphatase superfamily)
VELYIHSPNTPSWRGAQLKQGQLYLTLNVCSLLSLSHHTKQRIKLSVEISFVILKHRIFRVTSFIVAFVVLQLSPVQ